MNIELSPAVFALALAAGGALISAVVMLRIAAREVDKLSKVVEADRERAIADRVLLQQHEKQIEEWRKLHGERAIVIERLTASVNRIEDRVTTIMLRLGKHSGEIEKVRDRESASQLQPPARVPRPSPRYEEPDPFMSRPDSDNPPPPSPVRLRTGGHRAYLPHGTRHVSGELQGRSDIPPPSKDRERK